mgnify:CR=1 FL=1
MQWFMQTEKFEKTQLNITERTMVMSVVLFFHTNKILHQYYAMTQTETHTIFNVKTVCAFLLCVGHGTYLVGESPTAGIYRQA